MADTLPQSIRSHLLGDSEIAAKVGSKRIHYQVVPQTSQFPHVWFTRSGRDADELLDGDGLVFHRFLIEIAAKDGGETLADLVFDRLHQSEGPFDAFEIDSAFMEDADDSYTFQSVDSADALFLKAFELLVITE